MERPWRSAGAPGADGPLCLVLRPNSSLLYPHAEAIYEETLRLATARGLPVVLDLSASPFIDEDGVEALRSIVTSCGAVGLPVVCAEVASGVLQRMKIAGMLVPGLVFPTVDEACVHAIAMRKTNT
jgi:MFS superfamily sulfate permease-like transporter